MSNFSGISAEAGCRHPGWLVLRRYQDGNVLKTLVIEANEVQQLRDALNRHLRRMRAANG